MKKFRFIPAVLALSLLLLLTAAGCGNQTAQPAATQAPAQTEAPAPTQAPAATETPTAEPADVYSDPECTQVYESGTGASEFTIYIKADS